MIRFRSGRCTGGGAGAGFVGEQSPFYAIHEHCAKASCNCLPQAESLRENLPEYGGQGRCVFQNNKQCDYKVAPGHNGYQDVQYLDCGMFAQYDDCGQDHQHNGCVQGRNPEGVIKGRGNGVTDYLADTTPADQAGYGKEYGDQAAPALRWFPALYKIMDIISRSAAISAVERVFFFMELCQGCLCKCSGGADQCREPHPEYGACAACGNGGYYTDQVAHAYPCGGGNDQCLQA